MSEEKAIIDQYLDYGYGEWSGIPQHKIESFIEAVVSVRVESLEAENKSLREALEVYANKSNWHRRGTEYGDDYNLWDGDGHGYALANKVLEVL